MLQDDDEEEAGGGEAGDRKRSPTETVMVENAVRLRLESKELQERLVVSEATVEAQAERLKGYRDLLSESMHHHHTYAHMHICTHTVCLSHIR